jgi:hypothetical protein
MGMMYALMAAADSGTSGEQTGFMVVIVLLVIGIPALLLFLFVRVWRELDYFSIGLKQFTQKVVQTPEERGRITQADADYMYNTFRNGGMSHRKAERAAEAEARRLYGDEEVDEFLKYGDYRPRP